MSNVLIEKNKIDVLANAISCKSGEPVTMTLDEMVEAVDGIEQGITPTGNIDITSAGVTDVTNYATATVPQGEPYVAYQSEYITVNGARKWRLRGHIDFDDGEPVGWVDTAKNGEWGQFKAIATGTSVTPTESAQTIGGANYMMEGAVTVNAIPSNYVGSGITRRSSTDLYGFYEDGSYWIGGDTGYFANDFEMAVPNGTAGTPTATKGTVSNHSVSVTPSVTNTTGYITGSTKTGTAVTVSASELVSGTKPIIANGTGIDVTNYATVDVSVPQDTFVVTLSSEYRQGNRWFVPDKTYSEIASAVLNGLEIAIEYDGIAITNMSDICVSGSYNSNSGEYNYLCQYTQYNQTTGEYVIKKENYTYTSSGLTRTVGVSYYDTSLATINSTHVLNGYVGFGSNGMITGNIPTKTYTDLTVNGSFVTAPPGYYLVSATKSVASGTKGALSTETTKDSTFFNIVCSYPNATDGYYSQSVMRDTITKSLTLENITVAPSTIQRVVTPTNNSFYLDSVTIEAMPTGTAGTPTATKGSVSNHAISVTPSVTNTTGYITGSTINGTAVSVSASELVSGTYTVDSSGTKDVTNYASASVPAGTAGTPSASKGAVSNHSVSVTPSVTNTTGWITGSTKTGTAVTVSASELVSGSQTITQNGTVDVTNLAEVVVSVEGGGGSGMTVATATATPSSASASISFTGLSGEPTSFVVISSADLATGASPYKTAAVVFDGTSLHGQTITNTSNAQVSYDGTHFSKTYSNGTLTITGSTYWQANEYTLVYTYGGTSANIDTADVQVGSGATSITFTGLTDEPDYFSCIFKSNFSTSSGYQRVIAVVYDGNSTYGLAMDSGAKAESSWSYTYNNGSLTISSQGTNNGGYFHQPGYYQLTYGIGGTVEPTEIEVEPLSVTQNGTYTAPTGKAYSPVTVTVSGGSVNIDTKSMTNSSNQNTSISFSSMKGQPKAFFARCTSTLSRSSSNTYYYVADIVYDGTSTVGNMHARSNGQYSNITSGYSWSYSGTTLTLSSSGARNTSPGSFYNGTYELVYIY